LYFFNTTTNLEPIFESALLFHHGCELPTLLEKIPVESKFWLVIDKVYAYIFTVI